MCVPQSLKQQVTEVHLKLGTVDPRREMHLKQTAFPAMTRATTNTKSHPIKGFAEEAYLGACAAPTKRASRREGQTRVTRQHSVLQVAALRTSETASQTAQPTPQALHSNTPWESL